VGGAPGLGGGSIREMMETLRPPEPLVEFEPELLVA
jgi:hypothetical protein